ncbi:hypothetical protein OQA88_7812 [Cercophora sp. LCS_1]
MTWLPHGPSESGLVQAHELGRSRAVPAVATYRGQIWCVWADLDGSRTWYAIADGNDGEFGPRTPFPQAGQPVITNLNGHLHVILVLDSGHMAQFLWDDEEELNWVFLGPIAGFVTQQSPGLVAFHNKLFLTFINNGELYNAVWNNSTSHPTSASKPTGAWSEPSRISDPGHRFDGIPSLFVLRGTLHLVCGRAPDSHEIACYSYDYIESKWSPCEDNTSGRAALGVSATSYGDLAFLSFITRSPSPEFQTHTVCVSSYTDDHWQDPEVITTQNATPQIASLPPQLTILNGRLHCIFPSPTHDLLWYSRSLHPYSLSAWMPKLPSSLPLSHITIPGTHDSCARSNIPFVRTQYLSIPQQLHLGIRFLDLRLRTDRSGKLYCYHGGVPLGLPFRLSFSTVMDQVFTFLGAYPSETVLISINNDDPSPKDTSAFYLAVEQAITSMPPLPDGTSKWWTGSATPWLGQVRGKAVLLRRYAGDEAIPSTQRIGIDLSEWIDDSPSFTITTPAGVRIRIQDKWKFAERIALADLVSAKSDFVSNLMVHAVSGGDERPDHADEGQDWYINFCSAVGDPVEHGEIAEAKWIAVGAHSNWKRKWVNGMNTVTREFLAETLPGLVVNGVDKRINPRLGIVNLDYPELPQRWQ